MLDEEQQSWPAHRPQHATRAALHNTMKCNATCDCPQRAACNAQQNVTHANATRGTPDCSSDALETARVRACLCTRVRADAVAHLKAAHVRRSSFASSFCRSCTAPRGTTRHTRCMPARCPVMLPWRMLRVVCGRLLRAACHMPSAGCGATSSADEFDATSKSKSMLLRTTHRSWEQTTAYAGGKPPRLCAATDAYRPTCSTGRA